MEETKNKFEKIPNELKNCGYFCEWTWDEERKTKKPLAKTNDITTFTSFENIKNKERIGLGMFNNICGIDIDHCINTDGELSATATDILQTINSYAEISPSNTGVHILFKLDESQQIDNKNSDYYLNNRNTNVEVYQGSKTNKFLTLTGNTIKGYENFVEINQDTILKVLNKYMKKDTRETIKQAQNSISSESDINIQNDKEFLEIGLSKDNKLLELWNSIPSGSGGNESETDLALMNKLAYWTNKNHNLMESSFEDSNYYKNKDDYHLKKWERVDYRRELIIKAINSVSSTAREDNIKFNLIQERKENKEKELKKQKEVYYKEIEEQLKTKSILSQYKNLFEKAQNGEFKGISTGYNNLDNNLNGGILKKSTVVIGGGSGMGKTTFAINLGLNFIKQDIPVVYLSLEMSEEQIQAKIISNIFYTTKQKRITPNEIFSNHDLTNTRKRLIQEALEERKDLENFFVFYELPMLDSLIEKIETLNQIFKSQEKQSPILIVDYLQYIQGKPKEDEQETIKRATDFFKRYAIDNNTISIVLVANNREGTKEKEKSSFASGRGSSFIEYSSDYNIQLNFTEWEKSNGDKSTLQDRESLMNKEQRGITATIHKNRLGKSGVLIDFILDGELNIFRESQDYSSEIIKTTRRF